MSDTTGIRRSANGYMDGNGGLIHILRCRCLSWHV